MRRRLLWSALLSVVLLCSSAWADDRRFDLDVPAGNLGAAMETLAKQTGLQVLYDQQLLEGKTTPGLHGSYTAREALEKLLEGSGIGFNFTAENAVSLNRSAASGEPSKPAELSEINITANKHFLDEDTSGITNLPLPIEKVPQSISILNNDFVKAGDLKNIGEIAQYTPGGLWASFSPSYGNQFFLRGFAANYAIDGLIVGDQITEPDAAILERYEIVKGPASVVYGAQSPGGIVNLVSKQARPDTPSYLQLLGGSWGRFRVEGQLAGKLNDSGTIRGIGVVAYETGGSFVDFVELNKTVVYGGLDFDPAPGLTGYFRVSYQRTEDTPYNGIPTYTSGQQVPVARSFFMGGSRYDALAQAYRVDSGLSWKPDDAWSFDLKGVYQYTTHGGNNVYPYSTIATDGSFPIGGEQFNTWYVEDYTIGASAARTFNDIGLKDSSLSANIRYQHFKYYIYELGMAGAGPANIFAGDQAVSAVFNSLTPTGGSYQQDQREDYFTASSQAVIKVARPLTLVGGIAYSIPMIDQQVNNGAFENFNPGDQVNYRAAAIFEPAKGLNFYFSYSESYLPNLRVDASFNVLAPVKGKQYEAGAKYLINEKLLLTAALFRIDENNIAVFDRMIGLEAVYRAEDVRHDGLELEATGELADRWQIKGGVSLLDPRVTNDPTNPVNNGEIRPWLPRATANLYTNYTFRNGIFVSGGGRYVGPVKTHDNSSSPAPDLQQYIVADAAAGYSFDKWHLQFNMKNILDQHYSVPTPIFQSLAAGLYPGEPRSFSGSISREF